MKHDCKIEDLFEPDRCCGYHCRVCGQRFRSLSLDDRDEGRLWCGEEMYLAIQRPV